MDFVGENFAGDKYPGGADKIWEGMLWKRWGAGRDCVPLSAVQPKLKELVQLDKYLWFWNQILTCDGTSPICLANSSRSAFDK